MGWALVSDVVPLYPLYALLFAHAGLSEARISALFAIWSAVGLLAEVPAGALADRYSRRGALVVAGLLQGLGYAVWTVRPDFAGFAAGFVLWGLGGSLVSGAFEALLYDGLVAAGAESSFAAVLGRVRATGLLAQLPAALLATVLYRLGGYPLVGWASVACCAAAAGLAATFPEPEAPAASSGPNTAPPAPPDVAEAEESFLATLRAGLAEAGAHPAVRRAVLAVALLGGIDALEEYFTLLARDWGVPTVLVPLATLGIPLAGAAGAALAGWAGRLDRWALAGLLGVAAGLFGASGVLGRPAGLALVALFYLGYRLVLVRAETELQGRIAGTARATVTSVASLGTEVAAFGIYAAWTLGGVRLVAGLVAALALGLPSLLGRRGASGTASRPDIAGTTETGHID